MLLITIMDYMDDNSIIMCKAWIYLAKRYNPNAQIRIFYHRDISTIRQFASQYQNISFTRLRFPSSMYQISDGHTHHPVQELQLALWNQLETLHITKYIYIDADAFILSSLQDWWRVIEAKPFIAIAETRSKSGLRLNAGVYSYCDNAGFLTYKKLVEQYRLDGNRILIEAGAQGLINGYLRRVRHSFTHHSIGHEYNTLAKYCQVKRVDDKEIIVYSGRFPVTQKFSRILQLKRRDFCEKWLWWNTSVRVKILHAFGGPGFKFWELPECRELWDYCLAKTSTQ